MFSTSSLPKSSDGKVLSAVSEPMRICNAIKVIAGKLSENCLLIGSVLLSIVD